MVWQVIITHDGKYVLASNRGEDSIVVYRVLYPSGHLALASTHPAGGSFPRGMALVPGTYTLMVEGQSTGNLAVFSLSMEGVLAFTGQNVTGLPTPTAIAFAPSGSDSLHKVDPRVLDSNHMMSQVRI